MKEKPHGAVEPKMAPGPGHLYVVAAPSGTGKTSLVRALMAARPQLKFSVSYTTRPMRPNEVNGRDYHFVDRVTFEAMVERGELLEWARVFDNYYGTGLHVVQAALARGESLILEIDWQGAQQVRAKLPEAVQVFILPPSRAELEQRLRGRGTDSAEVIARRLQDSVTELSHWAEFGFVLVNDVFEEALASLVRVADAGGGPAVDDLRATRPGLEAFAAGLLQS
jgi:guanylate kinase